MILGALAVIVFIGLNGFFVAAEFALVKLRATLSRSAQPADPKLTEAVSHIGRYLSVTQLGITLASLGLGSVGEPAVSRILESLAHWAWHRPLPPAATSVIGGIALAILTFGHVLFGELVPKLVAIQRSEKVATASLWPLTAIFWLFRPALWLLEASSRAILNAFDLKDDTHSEAALSADEILGILAAYVAKGERGQDKQELLTKVVRFSERTARQAMIPRVDVAYLPIESSGAEALRVFAQEGYSRLPLSKGSELDEVVGYLYGKDLLLDPDARELANLETLRRDVLFVTEAQGLVDVLRQMQQRQTPFAVVADEYGGTAGILTMEDLLEEIVGEIRDELDDEAAPIERNGDVWDVDATVVLDELAETGVIADEEIRQATLGAHLLETLKRFPKLGDRVSLEGVDAEIIGVHRRRITRVRLHPRTTDSTKGKTPKPDQAA